MASIEEIKDILERALPPEFRPSIPTAARDIAAAVEAAQRSGAPPRLQSDPDDLRKILELLEKSQSSGGGSVVSFGNGLQAGNISIQSVAGRDVITVNFDIHQEPRRRYGMLQAALLVASLLAVVAASIIGLLLLRPELQPAEPLPEGEWTIAVAEPARRLPNGSTSGDPNLGWLERRMEDAIGQIVPSSHWRSVPSLTGTAAEREQAATALAVRIGASVVVSAISDPQNPDVKQAQLEIFVSPRLSDQSLAVEEIVGVHAFGRPITFVNDVTAEAQDDELNRRLDALQHFLNGTKYYIAEQYDDARSFYKAALEALSTGDGTAGQDEDATAAVIHEFLAAVELAAGDHDAALREAGAAHGLWEAYARPYLTRAAVLYSVANEALVSSGWAGTLTTQTGQEQCFTATPETPEALLAQALVCYDQALEVASAHNGQIDLIAVDLQEKVGLSKANIYLLYARYGLGDYWGEVGELVGQIIERYEAAHDSHERQRLRRLAAHAYFRRGLLGCIAPGTTRETCQSALMDYEAAIRLLENPRPDFSCAGDITRCYASDAKFIPEYRRELERTRNGLGG